MLKNTMWLLGVCCLCFNVTIADTAKLASDDQAVSTETMSDEQHNDEQQVDVEKEKTHYWEGSNAQLGFILNTGNTDSTQLNVGFNLIYTRQTWSNQFNSTAYFLRNDKKTTKEQYNLDDQGNYYFTADKTNFAFGEINFTHDKFSAYDYQVVYSAGYGRELLKVGRFIWTAQAGPGLRQDKVQGDDKSESNLVLNTGTTLKYSFSSKSSLSETISDQYGSAYNYIESKTAYTTNIAGNLGLQISYTLDNYSKIPENSQDTKNTDTITNIALVYNF